MHDFVAQTSGAPTAARTYVVLGDLNDFEFSDDACRSSQGRQCSTCTTLLPPNERYTYVFEGNSQALDHILRRRRPAGAAAAEYDSCTSTRSSTTRQSDHDPQVARLKVN